MLQTKPEDALALNNLAWVSHQLKDPKALEYAEKANQLAPDNAAILDTLGELLLEKGDVKRAVEMHQKAVELAPDSAALRMNLARALIKDGQKEPAKKELGILEKLGDKYPNQATVAKMMQGL
jgi:predicted Zn-dependent protease